MQTAKKVLFIGVGGSGMAPLAMWCAERGDVVSGYDDFLKAEVASYLAGSNVILHTLLIKDKIKTFDLIVYSSAVAKEHRLIKEAERLKIPCILRGEMLARVANSKKLIAIVGSHGKTSTCGLIAHAIKALGLGHNFILGGYFKDHSLPFKYNDSEWLVAEIDESDGTIDGFNPEITLLLNLDWDHCDFYKDFCSLKRTFVNLINRTRSTCLINQKTLNELEKLLPKDDLISGKIRPIRTESKIYFKESANLSCASFNQLNALFAGKVIDRFCEDRTSLISVLENFPGIQRRQNCIISDKRVTLIEDYAHHPLEIKTILQEVKNLYPNHDLSVVFQPHRFSRTQALKKNFVDALSSIDNLFLLPTYSAFENNLEPVNSVNLIDYLDISLAQELSFSLKGLKKLKRHILNSKGLNAPLVLFIGAGSVNDFAYGFSAFFQKQNPQEAWFEYVKGKVSKECILRLNEPLSKKTTFKIGGASMYYAEPTTCYDLQALVQSTVLFGLDYFCFGRGSNILVSDNGYSGLVMRFNHKNWRSIEILDNSRIWVGCGVRLKELCGYVAQKGYSGCEFLEGIPGTLGGALRMNAGAMGFWTFDIVDRVMMIKASGQVEEVSKKEFSIEYRKVKEIANGIAMGAIINLGEDEGTSIIRDRMDSYSDVRKNSQPIASSAGCIFKNHPDGQAGKLIDELDLKNLRIGGAEVSEVHGNFIINRENATSKDVNSLIQLIQKKVKSAKGIELETEVLFLGNE